ncbi:hypothetical protein C8J57DRAFT_1511076 [Mycena rebaudengoi]|nr:hypothetical protein C8J57DRAFT_1511076 [Mycena rebaudengoi]
MPLHAAAAVGYFETAVGSSLSLVVTLPAWFRDHLTPFTIAGLAFHAGRTQLFDILAGPSKSNVRKHS